MGKIYYYLSALIFMDLLFVITGQTCSTGACSLGSILFNALLNLQNFEASLFFSELIGSVGNLAGSVTGFASLLIATGVTIGTVISKSDTLLFIPMGLSLALIGADFIFIAGILLNLNFVLGTLVMAPLIAMYAFTALEWVKNKD